MVRYTPEFLQLIINRNVFSSPNSFIQVTFSLKIFLFLKKASDFVIISKYDKRQ